jgi:hypothetical protein
VIDDTTDLAFLHDILKQGWEALAVDSPNRSLVEPRVLLFRFTGDRSVPALLSVVAEGVKGRRRGLGVVPGLPRAAISTR